MPTYLSPSSDNARLTFLKRSITTAQKDIGDGNVYLSQETIDSITGFLPDFETTVEKVSSILSGREKEVREQNKALEKLAMTVRDLWAVMKRRVRRLDEPAEVLTYYKLPLDGTSPNPNTRKEWLVLARSVANGDADAVENGFSPAVCPSAEELKTLLTSVQTEIDDVDIAERDYDTAQEAVSELRPRADALIKEVIAELRFHLRHKDDASRRRVMRTYGADYRYLRGEPIEEGDEIPDEVENENEDDTKGKKDEKSKSFEPTSEAAFNQ